MGYYIRALSGKKKFPKWKVQFVSYKKADAQNSNAAKPKKEWDVSKERWRALGFLTRMSVDEAKTRAKQLNSLEIIKRQEKRLRQMKLEELEISRKYEAFLPEEFKEEFEKRFLRRRDSQTDSNKRKLTRAHTIWRAVQRLIIDIKIEPSEWYCNQDRIYDYFYENKFSLSYTNKMLALFNVWGFFICRKLDQPFLPVSRPRGYERKDSLTTTTNIRAVRRLVQHLYHLKF